MRPIEANKLRVPELTQSDADRSVPWQPRSKASSAERFSKAKGSRPDGIVHMQLARMLKLSSHPATTPEARAMVKDMHDRMLNAYQNSIRVWMS